MNGRAVAWAVLGLCSAAVPLIAQTARDKWDSQSLGVHTSAPSQSAMEITVHLFSTRAVYRVDVSQARATMQTCAGCTGSAVPEHLQVRWLSEAHLSVNGKAAAQALIAGQLRMAAEDGRAASGAGQWTVVPGVDGLHVLLKVPSERYVMAVLSSEADAREPLESLKALAVVVRSFALTNPDRHGAEGLCDSTHCQALRMSEVSDAVRQAVRATAGETLWAGERPVAGNFTQSCGGVSADPAEVWGGAKKPWLVSHPDPFCQRVPSQWHVSVDSRELLDALKAEGLHAPPVIASVRVLKHDGSGRASVVELAGGGQRVMLRAPDLRFAVDRSLGWDQIRSDWYVVQVVKGMRSEKRATPTLASSSLSRIRTEGGAPRAVDVQVVFDGKGHGHGVGLCQAGAAEMAREGKNDREILAFYFPPTTVRVGEGDGGWQSAEGHGWTSRRVQADATLIADGDAAWSRASSLFPTSMAVHPVVEVAPSTELFRQMSGGPGWALAGTRGAEITLQPLTIVRRNTRPEDLLLHEFLHVLVEAETGNAAPLWLREGLVEVLAGEKGLQAGMTPAQIDEALGHASSLQQARRAHRAACGLVRRLAETYGMSNVRGWLRSGVPANTLAGVGAGK